MKEYEKYLEDYYESFEFEDEDEEFFDGELPFWRIALRSRNIICFLSKHPLQGEQKGIWLIILASMWTLLIWLKATMRMILISIMRLVLAKWPEMNFTIFHGVMTWMNGEIDIAPETMYADSYPYTSRNVSVAVG